MHNRSCPRIVPLALAACLVATAAQANAGGSYAARDKVEATLIDAQGRVVGEAEIKAREGHVLRLELEVDGLPEGIKGLHIHAIGTCTAPAFTSAGPHWNPHGRQHGRDNPAGAHSGDLPNLTVNRKGRGRLTFDITGAHLTGPGGLIDEDGAAIVIHAGPDDYRTDPTGNSGDRIACGVFRRD
ncbi:MAG TPA: superoxide dismutase family protein [Novosphingobium sp.]|nr:superoxide dismutase family protein [Novosphingobium sp.]